MRICLRRTEQDLTVTADEILETKREGIRIAALMLSTRIVGKEKVEGVEFVRTQPGNLSRMGNGRLRPLQEASLFFPPIPSLSLPVNHPVRCHPPVKRIVRGY